MPIPPDYEERVYAGVLGKMIGVYLGRPFEGWTYERIAAELGEIDYYVHERLGRPLIVTDDDLSGTFTFLRALEDYGPSRDLAPAQIGQTWLNYLIENQTTLWWGGLGNSTEHTAYLRLKRGIPAPESGSIARNGQVVAEQIGAQIFIDGWGLVAPGDPELAADLARRAASVSHDGVALHAAQVIAAMEALAFVEPEIDRLLDVAVSLIPTDSVIARMIADLRAWHATGADWRADRERLAARYGYDRYGGNCHVVPNHGLIVLALLHGGGDFQRSLKIVNTCGWDTDCNSGNLGCLLGVRGGLAAIEAGPDWRGPVADRLYLPSADGGRAITDAVQETYRIVNLGRALAGLPPVAPKQGARFHFSLPGSVQGFRPEPVPGGDGLVTVANEGGALAIRLRHLAPGLVARVSTPTFIPPDALAMPGYRLLASPTLYPGQTLRAHVRAELPRRGAVAVRLFLRRYGAEDRTEIVPGPEVVLAGGEAYRFEWRIPDQEGYPIAAVGLELAPGDPAFPRVDGTIFLDWLTWDGAPNVLFRRPAGGGTVWRRAWVEGTDQSAGWGDEHLRLVQNEGIGLLIQGTREWTDYTVSARLTPHLVESCGVAVRVQGMRRYYALLLTRAGRARLVKALDGVRVLAEAPRPCELGRAYEFRLSGAGARLRAWLDGELLFDVQDDDGPLASGAIALVCEEGRVGVGPVRVEPA